MRHHYEVAYTSMEALLERLKREADRGRGSDVVIDISMAMLLPQILLVGNYVMSCGGRQSGDLNGKAALKRLRDGHVLVPRLESPHDRGGICGSTLTDTCACLVYGPDMEDPPYHTTFNGGVNDVLNYGTRYHGRENHISMLNRFTFNVIQQYKRGGIPLDPFNHTLSPLSCLLAHWAELEFWTGTNSTSIIYVVQSQGYAANGVEGSKFMRVEIMAPPPESPCHLKYSHKDGPFLWKGMSALHHRHIDLSSGLGFSRLPVILVGRGLRHETIGCVKLNPFAHFETLRDIRYIHLLRRVYNAYGWTRLRYIKRSVRWLVHEIADELLDLGQYPPNSRDVNSCGWACTTLASIIQSWYLNVLPMQNSFKAGQAIIEEIAVIMEREKPEWFPLFHNGVDVSEDHVSQTSKEDRLSMGPYSTHQEHVNTLRRSERARQQSHAHHDRDTLIWVNDHSVPGDIASMLGGMDRAVECFMFNPKEREELVMHEDLITDQFHVVAAAHNTDLNQEIGGILFDAVDATESIDGYLEDDDRRGHVCAQWWVCCIIST